MTEDDKPREACGVFGVYSPGSSAAHLTYDGLHALQHRGQESAGMAVSDDGRLFVVKDMGLVSHVFNEHTLAALRGGLAIGHTRYSTTGSSNWDNAQPVMRTVGDAELALGHNGNLTNTSALAAEAGMLPGMSSSDSGVLIELLVQAMVRTGSMESALVEVLPSIEGAFSLVLTDGHEVFAVRDPHGFRPLCLGQLRDPDGWVVASESPALDVIGATFVRDVEPGEMVILGPEGPREVHPFPPTDARLCVFEFVYFARPDSVLNGREVHGARRRMGKALAAQAPLPPALPGNEGCMAMVMGVPETGVVAAEGYAEASGIPYGQGLVKNRYMGRTFIAPDQRQRDRGVRRKLNPLRENIAGKRLAVLDDSIIRGTNSRQFVKMLRDAGAAEVHLRITSPPYRWPCYFGMDTGDPNELIANKKSVEEICNYVGADSLVYLTIDNLLAAVRDQAVDNDDTGYCTACITGRYPVEVPVGLGKHILEQV